MKHGFTLLALLLIGNLGYGQAPCITGITGPAEWCEGERVSYLTTQPPTGGPANLSWFIIDGQDTIRGEPTITLREGKKRAFVEGLDEGIYTIVNVAIRTGDTISYCSFPFEVNAWAGGSVQITESSGEVSNDGVICNGTSVLLEASNGVGYLWSTGANTAAINVTPPELGDNLYSVTITDDNGCSGTIDTIIETTELPSVTLSVVESSGNFNNDGNVCEGGTVRVTASGASSYQWSNGSTSSFVVLNDLEAADLPLTVTGFNSQGCSVTVDAGVQLQPLPNLSVAISDSDGNFSSGTFCLGETVILDAMGATDYVWSTGAQTASIQLTNLPAGPNTFTVTGFSAEGCSITTSTTIIVNPLPTTTITAIEGSGNTNNDGEVCEGASFTLTAGQVAGYSYAWSTGANSRSITVSNATAAASFYELTVTDNNGCSNVLDYTVTVNTPTTPTITVAEVSAANNNDGLVCTNDLVTLTASPGAAYQWSGGGESTRTIQRTVLNSGPTTFTVTVTDSDGCDASNSTQVTGLVRPNARITSSESSNTQPGDNAICAGESIQLTGAGGSSYAWSTGEQTRRITITNTNPSVTDYTVTVTSSQGCTDEATQAVRIDATPTASVLVTETSGTSVNDARVCVQDIARLQASGGVSYRWSGGNEVTSAVTRTVNSIGSNNYTTTVTSTAGCSSTATVTVTGLSLPNASISVTENSLTIPNDQTICDTESATLRANGGSGYSWSTGQNSQVITAANLGAGTENYRVTVTNNNGCSATANTTIDVVATPTPQITFDEDSGVPDDGRVCPGNEITLNASGAGSFTWTVGSRQESGSSITVDGNESGQQRITLTANDQGCTATTSRNVQIYEPPLADIGQIIGNRNAGRPLTVENESLPGSGEITRWLWNFGEPSDVTPATANVRNPPFIRYNTVGTKKVTLTTIDINECQDMDMRTFNVLEENSCQITGGFSNRTQCINEAFTIELSTQFAGTMIVNWDWDYPDGVEIISGGDTGNPRLRISNPGVYNFAVAYTDNLEPLPCTSPTVNFTVTVEEDTDPTLTLLDDSAICTNGRINVQVGGLTPGSDYQLFLDNERYMVREGSVISVPLGDAGLDTIRVTSVENISTQCVNFNTTGFVVVDVPPVPTVIIDGSYVAPCPGGELVLEVIEPARFTSFTWRDPLGNTFNTSDGKLSTIGQTGIYRITAIDTDGCRGTGTEDVELATRPEMPTITGPQDVCSEQFNVAYTSNAAAGAAFNWTVGSPGVIADTIDDGILVNWGTLAGATSISLVVEATPTIEGDGCASDPATLLVDVSLDRAPDTTEVALVNQNNQDFFLIAVNESACYQWGRTGSGPITGETFRTLFLGDVNGGAETILNGGYYVDTWEGDCTSQAACRNRSLFESLPAPDEEPFPTEFNLQLYPNPVGVDEIFTVEINGALANELHHIAVYDINGRVIVQRQTAADDRGSARVQLRTDQAPSGYYVVVATSQVTGARRQLPLIINR